LTNHPQFSKHFFLTKEGDSLKKKKDSQNQTKIIQIWLPKVPHPSPPINRTKKKKKVDLGIQLHPHNTSTNTSINSTNTINTSTKNQNQKKINPATTTAGSVVVFIFCK
jgi:hypothetical protein